MQVSPQVQLSALIELPVVRKETRAIFKSLLEHCEDRVRLSSFVLESIRTRMNTQRRTLAHGFLAL
ncbi:hypothetical protein CPB86DRAFT_782332 [Serendipita vermifera]|nr:hypothetical protein CPB86DRAFT_782332 [Serendipita vermifera]